MRVVRRAAELSAAIVSAKREAKAAFGDDRMLIEKYVDNPRHIEVQVVGDSHGNLVSLFERECTLQRRHQKVIEEAPSATLDAGQRAAIGLAARKAAGAVDYVGAGTIEFVSDGRDFFFIEMNTRLQVEHPVTELVTDVDLVEWQLRVAFGEALPLRQEEILLKGHAIEARVYAENPAKNFMPSVGRIRAWRMPDERGGVRIDAGYRNGSEVSPHYDAMLAKVIAFGETREAALDRIVAALDDTDVRGVVTNVSFLSALLSHGEVRSNRIDTGFIERNLKELTQQARDLGNSDIGAAVAAVLARESVLHDVRSPWSRGGWMPGGERRRKLTFRDSAGEELSAVQSYGGNGMTLEIAGKAYAFALHPGADGIIDSFLNGTKTRAVALWEDRSLYLRTPNGRFELSLADPFGVDQDEHAGEDRIVAPLPGTVVAILAEEGASLEKGAPILTLEVMKMEQTLRAPFAGTLKRLKCKVGDIVQEGVELAEIEPSQS
jgi:3-methylcrotonyl-CoA carboxylase alpha subunit